MDSPATRVIFMGSPAFAVPSLQALVREGYDVALVVTQPDRPAGRGGRLQPPAVKVAAEELGLNIVQPETLKDESLREMLRAIGADVFVVAAYGKILPRAILEIPRRGCINVHASLLPRWRGASPIDSAILAGDRETGVSIMELVQKMDAGPVIAQARTPVGPEDTTGSLEPRLAELGAEILVRVLPGWLDGSVTARPQDESLVTTCTLIKKEDGFLRSSMHAVDAERAVRAYQPWPGAYVVYDGERLMIWKAHVDNAIAGEPGTLTLRGKLPAVAFADGWLVLDEVQRAGSKRLSGRDFVNGERGHLEVRVELRND
ncbi:MAG: methionyl-tRNA formyltransferase [Dehalococcoidia bacterium]|nr:methionyl-tRNA formyltransferase [Dehalococcoidia bacterium]